MCGIVALLISSRYDGVYGTDFRDAPPCTVTQSIEDDCFKTAKVAVVSRRSSFGEWSESYYVTVQPDGSPRKELNVNKALFKKAKSGDRCQIDIWRGHTVRIALGSLTSEVGRQDAHESIGGIVSGLLLIAASIFMFMVNGSAWARGES